MADRPPSRATRRQVLAGGAAFLGGLPPGTRDGAAAAPVLNEGASGPAAVGDAAILELEQQARAMAGEWLRAADAFARAEEACWALLKNPDADDAAKDEATARQLLADGEANSLAEAVDELVLKLCSTPAESLTGLACKARAALWLDMDGLAELVLRDLVRLADASHG